MQIIEVTEQFALRIDEVDPDRSTGLHVSTLIRRIALRLRWFKPDDPDEERFTANGPDTLRVMLGLAWEEWLAAAHPQLEFHGGEIYRDNIAMSPDALSYFDGRLAVHEFKCTWKSARKEIQDELLYLMQLKAYCKAMRSRIGFMHVYYVNGTYRHGGPLYRVWMILFEQGELDANWNTILQEAAREPSWKGLKHGK